MADETERLLDTDRSFAVASLQHGAAEAFRMFLHDDATMFTTGSVPIKGRDFIYKRMKSSGDGAVLQWTPRAAEVSASGDLGWTWGDYVMIETGKEGERRAFGYYVNVWKKDDDGQWKVVADIGTEAPAPEHTIE